MSVVVVSLALTGTLGTAWAHPESRLPVVVERVAGVAPEASPVGDTGASADGVGQPQRTSPTTIPLFAVCLAAIGLTILSRYPRWLAASALAVLLMIVAFESSVHAVHHLGDPDGGARCAVASITSQLSGTPDLPDFDQSDLNAATGRVVVAARLSPGSRPLSPQWGRAPPSTAS